MTEAPAETPSDQKTDDKADSSPAEGDKGSMLDAVKAAIKPKSDAPPASHTPEKQAESSAEPGKDTDTPKDGEPEGEPSEDETKNWSARTQRRFRKLNSDVKARDQLIEQLNPKAQEFDRIDTFVRNAGLSAQDVQGTLQIAAQMRSDPVAAYRALVPIMAQLETTVGNVLPPHLQQRVDAGLLTQEDALAVSRSAAHASLAERQLAERNAAERDRTERETRQRQLDGSVQSVETWEQQRAARDPDWHLKQPEIRNAVRLEVAERRLANPGWIPTSEEALQITQEAEKQVAERMKRFIPKAEAMPRHANVGGASPRAAADPKSMLDVVRATMGR